MRKHTTKIEKHPKPLKSFRVAISVDIFGFRPVFAPYAVQFDPSEETEVNELVLCIEKTSPLLYGVVSPSPEIRDRNVTDRFRIALDLIDRKGPLPRDYSSPKSFKS